MITQSEIDTIEYEIMQKFHQGYRRLMQETHENLKSALKKRQQELDMKELEKKPEYIIDPTMYSTVKEFAKKYSSMVTMGGLRHTIFYADTNGAKCFIRKVGRRILINEQKYFAWIESQNKDPK